LENITGEMLGWEARAESAGGTSGNVERESYDFIRAAVAAGGRATEWVRRAWRRALCVTSEKGWYRSMLFNLQEYSSWYVRHVVAIASALSGKCSASFLAIEDVERRVPYRSNAMTTLFEDMVAAMYQAAGLPGVDF